MKTAQQAAANWTGSQGRATTAYADGVNAYTGDWAGATVAQQGTMVTNWTTSISNGTWQRGVQATGTGGWKQATVAKQSNYSTGFSAGANNYAAASQKIMSALANIVPNLPARGSFDQNKIRATTLMDALHAQRGQLGAK